MASPFKEIGTLQSYPDRTGLKWFVTLAASIISIGSIVYTNYLVNLLKENETRYISLFARSLETAINEEAGLTFFTQDIIAQNNSIPVIQVDEEGVILAHKNVVEETWTSEKKSRVLGREIERMKEEYAPIPIPIRSESGAVDYYQYVYYRNSYILTQLTYYPYVQLSVIAIFGVIAYLAFSYSKTAEQNRVWVGMAKETAHQLGTPLSSLMAWVEYIKQDDRFNSGDHNLAEELDKDVQKLQIITERFSSIGSVPVLKEEDVEYLIRKTVNYLQSRLPNRVHIAIEAISPNITAKLSPPLFEWVIENLCKNAVDAMNGSGNINIKILRGSDYKVFIDLSDDGKGIPKSKIRQVFSPGFTTKKRGWGLGLTLVKRIIENYHNGKIFVKYSEPEKGTAFRIVLSTQT